MATRAFPLSFLFVPHGCSTLKYAYIRMRPEYVAPSAESKEAVIEALGTKRAYRVFAGLYMARQDVSVIVRQVW